MQRILFFFIIASMALNASAQSSTSIKLPEFHTIEAEGAIHLQLNDSGQSSFLDVELYGLSANDFNYRVKDGVLHLGVPTGILAPKGHIRVVATTPSLRRVVIDGCEVETIGMIEAGNFSFESKGVDNFARLNLSADNLTIDVDSRCYLELEGSAQSATVVASSGSRVDALDFRAESLSVEAYEGSKLYLYALGRVEASVSTLAEMLYSGDGEVIFDDDILGKITKIETKMIPKVLSTSRFLRSEPQDANHLEPQIEEEQPSVEFF